MEHLSLHSYLESCFADSDVVTDDMIIKAKQEYRLLYLSRYYKTYRETHKQVNIRVTKYQYETLEEKAKSLDLKVSSFVKQSVFNSQNSMNSQTRSLMLLILQAVDTIEEAIEEQEMLDMPELLLLIDQMQNLLNDS